MKEFTKNDTVRDMYTAPISSEESNIGKVAILPYRFFERQYRKPEYQLFRLRGGFGTSPLGRGNACFGHFCVDGEECRIEKYSFVGIGNEEIQRIGAEMEAKWQSSVAQGIESVEME